MEENKIVIIGNGFDLRHFLPTSYNHLICILTEIEKFPENLDDINFSTLFDGVFKEKNEWFYHKIKEFYDTDNFTFDVNEILNITKRLKGNCWFQYLKSVDENKIDTWIDFETEITRVLKQILSYFYQISNNTHRFPIYGNFRKGECYYIPQEEYGIFETGYVLNNLQIYILNFFKFLEIDSDNSLAILNNEFILSLDNQIQYFKEKEFFDFIYKSLEDFIGIFNDYIIFIVNQFYDNFREDKKENFIKQGSNLFSKVSKVYSFNYTHTFQKYYYDILLETVKSLNSDYERKIEYLHGNAVEDWNENTENLKIVLGVNEIDAELKNHKLFQFTKYFQKLHKDTDYYFLDDIINDVNNDLVRFTQINYNFYFWGHSLDISDKDYIDDIFYIVRNSRSKILIFYHDISSKASQLKNLLSVINDKDVIESLMKSGKLQFIEATNENLFKELS